MGEFDMIFTPQVPLQYPLFYIAAKWTMTAEERFDYRVRAIAPSGAELFITPPHGISGSDGENQILIHAFVGREFLEFGTYTVEERVDDTPLHAMTLTVQLVRPGQKRG